MRSCKDVSPVKGEGGWLAGRFCSFDKAGLKTYSHGLVEG